MSQPTPTGIERLPERRLRIAWSDGQTREYSARELRGACPCASCREKQSAPPPSPLQLNVLSEAETLPLEIIGMAPVGSYAYRIHFSDGHNTGLFTFERLRELGESA
ncbi:hypothetical protein Pla175_51180 [Pirellulimonas nuda]|uniref:Gamma-butyrobetaine hydroxylase-like N-terminal domain-containing protein n=1 Tax=Pirellulimonas nuda TaxID=2528009 RepID=A0A518DJN4_9BACT|nr:DUF971 domain-containing protein [Pirellulimonas nuda]QDU91688.1 hypothetical protein Pla175_51180 [Pirellulimonas nuda]